MLKMFRNTIYIRLKADEIHLLQVESGNELSLPPEVALDINDGKKFIVAVGNEVKEAKKLKPSIEVLNGFKHPRTLLADFMMAEQVLKHCLRKLKPKSLLPPNPVVIFHPLEKNEGGFTQVEMTAFEELCRQAGARKVFIHEGEILSKQQLTKISESGIYGL